MAIYAQNGGITKFNHAYALINNVITKVNVYALINGVITKVISKAIEWIYAIVVSGTVGTHSVTDTYSAYVEFVAASGTKYTETTFTFSSPVNLPATDAMSCLSATDYKQPKQIQIGTWRTHEDGRGFRATEDNNCPTIPARAREDGSGQPVVKIGAIRGRNPQNPLSRVSGLPTEQMLEINENGTSNALTTVQKDNVVVIPANNSKGYDIAEEEEDSINFSNPNSETRRGRVGHGVSQTLDTACNQGVLTKQRIRRLTPAECFRLMDFNEDFKWNVSDSQAYKQAGNSIVVSCLVEIISKLKL